jgi:hypothetical protein
MMTQGAPESHILHQGLIWRRPAVFCPIERGIFSLLINMIRHRGGWTCTNSIGTFLQVQFLDTRSNGHMDFSLSIQEWRIQYTYREQLGRVTIVQCQDVDLQQRLAWDPGITRMIISLTDMGKWTFAGESYPNFPLSFRVEESTSLKSVSRRSCSTSFWHQHM